ncbi:L-lysine 2-3-aminomutase [Penicillium bovifimosum]|uniref:L-lysine 2-3-aminomutase n=1 Tax=Penicillium bovifimosum TaxID=126998 RepID=A0A9W9GM79_9EURO|nr:L-lysine 2-3-aminomutase [Penicillium bovifimosum]KAJ5124093.1 L-lysine 2-3-aminomutase [Penicillium bovifimosum]
MKPALRRWLQQVEADRMHKMRRKAAEFNRNTTTYDHRVWKTGLPVRSAVLKPHAGELVVGWVTTSESSLLYVFLFFPILLRS